MRILKRIGLVLFAVCLMTACAAEPVLKTEPPAVSTTEAATQPTQSTQTAAPPETTQPTEPEPDTVSILDFLRIAAQPVGSTMYVWGGGWNEEDTGAGTEAVTLGVSPQWAAFAARQDSAYNYKDTRYQIHDGLDCSGYVGWAVYNAVETEDGQPGYVYSSTKMAQTLADQGFGQYIGNVTQWLPGDIMSMKGHCWIVVGMCGDGSVLLLHASPPGVMFSGTLSPDGSESEASQLAREIMAEHYPDWYARYPESARPSSYLTKSSAMRWSALSDEEGLRDMTAEEVVEMILATE